MTNRLQSMGVRGRLLLAFFGISAFAVIGAVAALFAFAKVGALFDRVANERLPESFAALELSRQAERIAAAAPLLVISADTQQQVRIDREIRLELTRLGKLFADVQEGNTEPALLTDVSNAVAEIRQNLAQLQVVLNPYDFLTPQERLAKGEILLRGNREASARLTAAINRLVDNERMAIAKAGTDITVTQRNTAVILLGVVALSLISSGLIVWLYIGRNIIARLQGLAGSMLGIAQGNLGTPLPVNSGSDEIGRMADSLRIFRDTALENERMGRLKRFLPPQVAELIVSSSGGESVLESHRRDVAVLFCDLRGFTAFAESAEPEEVMELLRGYHSCLGQLVHKYAGTLERFTGDGLIVLFNDPLPCADPCLTATRLAVEMRAAVNELSGRWQQFGSRLGFGIGIAYGYATLGRVGFESRFDYTAIGSVVNLAARLCEKAKPGEILIDRKVKAAIEGYLTTEVLGEFAPKGFSRPVEVFNIGIENSLVAPSQA